VDRHAQRLPHLKGLQVAVEQLVNFLLLAYPAANQHRLGVEHGDDAIDAARQEQRPLVNGLAQMDVAVHALE